MEHLVGSIGKAEAIVDHSMTAGAVRSGSLPVFSTPSLVALMECAACDALSLAQGQTSVGVGIEVKHTAPTPVGMRVRAAAKVVGVDKRTVSFCITAQDDKGLIGEAAHTRAIVDVERFMKRVQSKIDDGER